MRASFSRIAGAVCIPTGSDHRSSEEIASMEEALAIADAHSPELDVDDWT